MITINKSLNNPQPMVEKYTYIIHQNVIHCEEAGDCKKSHESIKMIFFFNKIHFTKKTH